MQGTNSPTSVKSPKSELTDRDSRSVSSLSDEETFVILHLTNQTLYTTQQHLSQLSNYTNMSGDLDNDEVFDRLEAVGERTSNFATNVIGLLKFIPTAVNNLRTNIKSLKDTITQKDAAIAAKDTELALKDDELDLRQDTIKDLEAEVKDLKAGLVDARKQIHNAQSATCEQVCE